MRRYLLLVLFALFCATAQASDPVGWVDTFSLFFRGASAEPVAVDASNPLPVTMTGVTVSTEPPSTSSQTVILLSGTDAVIASLANRVSILLTATGTFEYSTGLATVPANTTPCYSASFEAGPGIPVAVKTSATATYLTIRQLAE